MMGDISYLWSYAWLGRVPEWLMSVDPVRRLEIVTKKGRAFRLALF